MSQFAHSLERSVVVRARRADVFRYFTDSARFSAWWGAGSSIGPRAGGAISIRYPNGVMASGNVVEIVPPERIVFSYGYEDPQKPIAPGGSRVTVTLDEIAEGTRLSVRHDLDGAAARDEHGPGWRFQLSLLANAVAREINAGFAEVVDRFFAAWVEPDAAARRAGLAAVVTPDVGFRDNFATIEGLDELVDHIRAVQTFMPGMALARAGEPRHCQGTALVDWKATGPDGAARGAGTNVFSLDPDGRIFACVGFWAT
jgi:uncharacterized protein YndB with AHSA1/START domain